MSLTELIEPRDIAQPTPLTYAQEPIWFLDQLEPGGASYLISSIHRLSGALRISVLEGALTELVRRHESLRTTFLSSGGKPFQEIRPPTSVSLVPEVIQGVSPQDREDALQKRIQQLSTQSFSLTQAPLFRIALLRLGAEEHVLGFFTHHIVMDGWSMGVLWKELTAL